MTDVLYDYMLLTYRCYFLTREMVVVLFPKKELLSWDFMVQPVCARLLVPPLAILSCTQVTTDADFALLWSLVHNYLV